MAASPGLASGTFFLSLGTRTMKALLKVPVLLPRLSLPSMAVPAAVTLDWSRREGQPLNLEGPAGVGVLEGKSGAQGKVNEG